MILVSNEGLNHRIEHPVAHLQDADSPLGSHWPDDRGVAFCGRVILHENYSWAPIPLADETADVLRDWLVCTACVIAALAQS